MALDAEHDAEPHDAEPHDAEPHDAEPHDAEPHDPEPPDPEPHDPEPHDPQPHDIVWMSTQEAARRLGVTTRTLYRFVDEGELPAYRMGRVFRLQQGDVDAFIERSRIVPGSLEHLYPERKTASTESDET